MTLICRCVPALGTSNRVGVGKISSFLSLKREYHRKAVVDTAEVTINDSYEVTMARIVSDGIVT